MVTAPSSHLTVRELTTRLKLLTSTGTQNPTFSAAAASFSATVTAPSSPLARSPRYATSQIPAAFLISLPQLISTGTGNSISLSPLPGNVFFAISRPFLSKSSLATATALSNRLWTWASPINTSPLGISMAMERWIWRPRQASTREAAWFTSCLARATARPSQFTVDSEAGPNFILVADVNGDGLADLLLADPADNLAD